MKRLAVISLVLWPHVGFGFQPDLPNSAEQLADDVEVGVVYALPTGVFENGTVPFTKVTGDVLRRSWKIEGGASSPLALMDALRQQVEAEGYFIQLECAAQPCGGFGFRYGIDVLTPPDMFVDLADFHFLSATKGWGSTRQALTILTSQTALANMVQVVEVTPSGGQALQENKETAQDVKDTTEIVRPVARPDAEPVTKPDLIAALEVEGHVVLPDLEFASGSSKLVQSRSEALPALAAWLAENASRKVALVGHTDNAGGAETNLALSQGRAEAVMRYLIEEFAVPADQLEARGVGFFAPVVSNATAEGREQNRRVEVVILSNP